MRADIFIVRMLPFVHFVLYGIITARAWMEIRTEAFFYLHGESAIYALSLFIISLSNKHYHCRWNRAMYVEAIIVPVINYIDARYHIFPYAEFALLTMSAIWSVTLILTAYLAIRHYMIPRLKKKKNGRV